MVELCNGCYRSGLKADDKVVLQAYKIHPQTPLAISPIGSSICNTLISKGRKQTT